LDLGLGDVIIEYGDMNWGYGKEREKERKECVELSLRVELS
jgi:hypothetical protein